MLFDDGVQEVGVKLTVTVGTVGGIEFIELLVLLQFSLVLRLLILQLLDPGFQ